MTVWWKTNITHHLVLKQRGGGIMIWGYFSSAETANLEGDKSRAKELSLVF